MYKANLYVKKTLINLFRRFFEVELYYKNIKWGYSMEFFRKNRKVIILTITFCFLLWTFGSMLFIVLK